MKKLIAGLSLLMLTACSTATTPVVTLQQRQQLSLNQTSPLNLKAPSFKVAQMGGKVVVVMSLEDYAKLATAMEQIQDKLSEQNTIIQQTKKYDAPKK